jgi:glycosyltransferase involved in cell wall biosynthesis
VDISVAVIIPTFNRAHIISETIDSILSQSLPPAEIIVVDDGSTDHTEGVISRYDGKVKYIRIDNSGVCRARNVGVENAQSEWIAFCDGDDLWYRDKLFYQVSLIRDVPEVEYSFTNFRIIKDEQSSTNTKFDDAPPDYWNVPRRVMSPHSFVITEPFYNRLLRFQPIFPSTVMMTKNFFYRIGGFDESFGRKMSEDFEFTLRCSHERPIGVIKEPVVGIRWHGENFSQGKLPGISFIIGDIDILRYSMKNHRLGILHKSVIEDQIVGRSIVAANGAFTYGEFTIMRDMLKNIPAHRMPAKLWVKAAIAKLPYPLAIALQKILVR